MARNPYSGVGNADSYANGNGYGGLNAPRSNDDYDPYSSNSDRDRRPNRNGGYGGFSDAANTSAPAVQPVASRQDTGGYGYEGYNSRPDEPAPPRSPRRVRMPDPRPRQDGGYGDTGRNADTRRRGERLYQNGNDTGTVMASNKNRGATRGGNGTRQIEGWSTPCGLLYATDRLSLFHCQVTLHGCQKNSISTEW